MESSTKYHRLEDEESSEQGHLDQAPGFWQRRKESLVVTLLVALLSLSVVLNAVLLSGRWQLKSHAHASAELSRYADLPKDEQMRFEMETDYSGLNETLSDELWDSISTSHGAVALTDDYIKSKGLLPARRFPWDESKGLYYVQGAHLMHCLKLIRKSHREYAQDLPQSGIPWHTRHCFDALRMDIMCKASDTPLPTQYPPLDTGEGAMLQCRSWDKLRSWALAPERNACFFGAEEDLPVEGWERFSNCLPGSPYQAIADDFVENRYHKNRTAQ